MRAPDLTHRLAIYRRLSRLLFPHRYAGKILLLAFAATHVPLLALVGYLVLGSDLGGGEVWRIVGVAVAATVGGDCPGIRRTVDPARAGGQCR